jgi:hypothetical protein
MDGLGLVIGNHQVHCRVDGQLNRPFGFVDPLGGAVELVLRFLRDGGGLREPVFRALVLVRFRGRGEAEENPRDHGKGAEDKDHANEAGPEGSCFDSSVCHVSC